MARKKNSPATPVESTNPLDIFAQAVGAPAVVPLQVAEPDAYLEGILERVPEPEPTPPPVRATRSSIEFLVGACDEKLRGAAGIDAAEFIGELVQKGAAEAPDGPVTLDHVNTVTKYLRAALKNHALENVTRVRAAKALFKFGG
jgi:hypothetical protein